MKNFIIVLLSALIFCGCSITPRYHSFGYNVEWKTRGTTRAKTSASPIEYRSESQKRSNLDRNEITGEENRSELVKTGTFKEEHRFLIDTIRKTEFSIPVRIALDTAEKNVRIENQDPGPTVVRDGHKSANWGLFLSIIGLLALPILGPLYLSPIAFVLSLFALVNSERKSKARRRGAWGAFLGYVGLAFATVIVALLSYGFTDLLLLSFLTMVVLPLLLYFAVKATARQINHRANKRLS